MVITSRDQVFLAVIAVAVVASVLLALVFRRQIAKLLTPVEWRIFGKLVAIIVLVLVLLLMDISLRFPAEMFTYGRF